MKEVNGPASDVSYEVYRGVENARRKVVLSGVRCFHRLTADGARTRVGTSEKDMYSDGGNLLLSDDWLVSVRRLSPLAHVGSSLTDAVWNWGNLAWTDVYVFDSVRGYAPPPSPIATL